jgi:hypothetical protein
MTIFFQHVGEANSNRDFRKTLFDGGGLIRFTFDNVEPYLQHLPKSELTPLAELCEAEAADGFQIWGIPSGAKSVLKIFVEGDQLLLLKSITYGGAIEYSGRAVGIPRQECFELSQHLWGDARFPLICFLIGSRVHYPWLVFLESFGFKSNWDPAGMTWRLLPKRIKESRYGTEDEVIRAIMEFKPREHFL